MQRLLAIICRVLTDNPRKCLIHDKGFSKKRINVTHKPIKFNTAPPIFAHGLRALER